MGVRVGRAVLHGCTDGGVRVRLARLMWRWRHAGRIPPPLRWFEARGGRSPVVCALLGPCTQEVDALDSIEACRRASAGVSTWTDLGRPPDRIWVEGAGRYGSREIADLVSQI